MGKDTVIFKKSREDELVAFFPDEPANPGMILCYAHIGQHSEASMGFFQECVIFDDENDAELNDLKSELLSIGYDF